VEERAGAGATGHGRPLASGRAAGMLEPSIAAATRQTTHRSRTSSPHPADSPENPLWCAPRIHGELLKLGMIVSERTVSRYLPNRGTAPSQTWRTFLANQFVALASSVTSIPPGDAADADARLCLAPSIRDGSYVIHQWVVVEWQPSFQRATLGARVAQDLLHRRPPPSNKDPPQRMGPSHWCPRTIGGGHSSRLRPVTSSAPVSAGPPIGSFEPVSAMTS
jgi:hypothetical protein